MVPFNGEIINDVINVMTGLGIKRNAEGELMPEVLKRRKVCVWEAEPPIPAISSYANNLRKIKKKLGCNGKRKVRGEKENILEEEEQVDEAMVDLELPESVGDTFVFKAKRGRKKKTTSEDPVGSDHHALVIDCCFSEDKAPKTFKFEAYWVEHDDFLHIVENSWNEVVGVAEYKVLDLIRRLDACRKRLIEWNRRAFPNFRKVIDFLRKGLSLCYTGNLNVEKLVEAENLVKQIEEAFDKEEVYWWQRSRISWLNYGDRNTKFFHGSVIQRRQRNKVLRLKDESGVWLEDRKEINKVFSNFYTKLFSSVGSRPLDQALSYVSKVVSPQDNDTLARPISDLEIEEVEGFKGY
ncbi:hypothetical protein K1719_038823 [Acacia pycnantha]|nr:hypothetical protein K1719_038823 [Acacia pycnantha]